MEEERLDSHDYEVVTPHLHRPFKFIQRMEKINLWITYTLGLIILLSLPITSCKKDAPLFTPEEREEVNKLVFSTHGIDSLTLLQKKLESEGNRLGNIVALKQLGNELRRDCRFEEALRAHSKGLQQAELIGDTLEWIQALNNIGTDYRRMGVLDAAQEYHYSAWTLSKEMSDSSYTAQKNRVTALNGLGNIYMTLGNYQRADSALRLALEGEQALGSAVGQAINYSNLGSIFEKNGRLDSAFVYYQKSMALNKEVNNQLGISLCHTYLGGLYEKQYEYDKAKESYTAAYNLMKDSPDEWHALNSLIALARLSHTLGEEDNELEYLSKAKAMAERIKSTEHQAEVYNLYYEHYKHSGDFQSALISYERANALQDSLLDMEKVNRIQNISLKIERDRQAIHMGQARQKLEQERNMRYIGFTILGFILLILAGLLAMLFYTGRLRRRNHLALKRISTLRELFFTNVTHEFRTPLTVILGLSHDLQEMTFTPEEVGEKAKVMERQGKGLLALINQLLDISKIKSSVGNPDWRCGNITAFLNMIAESYHDFAMSRNIDLQFFAKDDVEMDFVPDYAVKIMNNLLSNALKFTPEYGKVSVTVWREDEQLRLEVADTGEGIAPEALTYIFEPFYQAGNDTQHIGTGVGLALVKQIIDAIEGKIAVESTQGKGTTFRLSIPIHNYCQQRLSNEIEYNKPILPEKKEALKDAIAEDSSCHLLIIEDNTDIAAYIGSQFGKHCTISYATNGIEGLEKAKELVPDLIITDLMMPKMDGFELCRQVRSDEIINHIPIVVITAKISEKERINCIESGADAYLAKPFNGDELRTRVNKLLESRRLLQEKFMQTMIESKGNREEEETAQPDRSDLRFLTKITDTIYLQLNRQKEINVSLLASNMCMSNSQFYRKVVALTGYTPAAYIQRIKIKKAKTLLEGDADLSFSDIADQCGFNNYSNFVRAFKNVCGITPSDYKRGKHPNL